MRDFNHRTVLGNKPVVTITSTVYDRRALDTNSDIPLINSLNHLTYLTSNSEKVRETLASDGALSRLVSILHGCYIPLFQLLDYDLKNISKHRHAQMVWKQKKLAMCAWKWTLAFQCLVLTGTRGTEQIRKKVVSSGVIPLLATVLDNYLIYHKNYDHFTGSTLDVDISSLQSQESYYKLRKNSGESYEQYMEYITGRDPFRLSCDSDFVCEELLRTSMTLPTDFNDICTSSKCVHSYDGCDTVCHQKSTGNYGVDGIENCGHGSSADETILDKDHYDELNFQAEDDTYYKLSISVPRDFFLGRLIPKQDDVIWSLQLLAFISKYTYMKQQLQNVELIEPLSFRAILKRVKERIKHCKNPMENSNLSFSKDIPMEDAYTDRDSTEKKTDTFLIELKDLVREYKNYELNDDIEIQNPFSYHNISVPCSGKSTRIQQEKQLVEEFERKWDINSLSVELDDDTWSYINSAQALNLFPLVERCTVSHENPHDMVYWSSVIMRNSCRKNEVTGVRQCANFDCGKWEDYPRQFAKCRRCKRTKYCSRECQLKAWSYHRFWCHEGGSSIESSGATTGNSTPSSSQNSTATTATRRINGNRTSTNQLANPEDTNEANSTTLERQNSSFEIVDNHQNPVDEPEDGSNENQNDSIVMSGDNSN